jgi:hypothetical protein
MNSLYLRVEAVNFDDFIYDTNDLSTRRGGSLLLLEAINKVTELLKNMLNDRLKVIQEGASVGFYKLDLKDSEKPEDIVDRVKEFLNKFAAHASFRIAKLPVSGLGANDFLQDRQRLIARARWDQMMSPSVQAPNWNKDINIGPCEIDMVRPGIEHSYYKKKPVKVSSSVHKRREYGKKQKKEFYAKELALLSKKLEEGLGFVDDLDELTEDEKQGSLNHKMAVISIDGNSFGKQYNSVVIKSIDKKPEDAFHDASESLKNKRREVLAELLKRMDSDSDWRNGINRRFETLLWGGDEIIWVVPAWKGWETVQLFYELAINWEIVPDKKVTHAAGVVFCHHKAPIQRIIKLADDLSHIAKDIDRKENLVAFQVLESFDFTGCDLSDFRKKLVPGHHDDLVIRPAKMNMIPKHFKRLKEVISNKRAHQAAKAAHESDSKDRQKTYEKLVGDAGKAEVNLDILRECLGKDDDVFWYHVRELWDYIPDPKEENIALGRRI